MYTTVTILHLNSILRTQIISNSSYESYVILFYFLNISFKGNWCEKHSRAQITLVNTEVRFRLEYFLGNISFKTHVRGWGPLIFSSMSGNTKYLPRNEIRDPDSLVFTQRMRQLRESFRISQILSGNAWACTPKCFTISWKY